jgi:hypothetical protein
LSEAKLDRLFTTVSVSQAQGLLDAIAGRLESGFSVREAAQVGADLAALDAEDSLLIEPFVSIDGTRVPFFVDVEKLAGNSVELTIVTAPPLTDWLERHLRALGDDVPLEVLRVA